MTSGTRITNGTLQEFADELVSFRETLHAIGCLPEVNQRALVHVAERLPMYIQHRWKRQVSKLRERSASPGIDHLVQFIQSAAREVNDPVFGDFGVSNTPKPASQSQRKGFYGATVAAEDSNTGRSQDGKRCPACHSSGCQSLFKCGEFLKMSPEKRFHLAKNNRLYCNCRRRGHSSGKCKIESTCIAEGCKIKYTKFLHTTRGQTARSTPASSSSADPPGSSKAENVVCRYVTINQGFQSGPTSRQDQSHIREWAFSRYLCPVRQWINENFLLDRPTTEAWVTWPEDIPEPVYSRESRAPSGDGCSSTRNLGP